MRRDREQLQEADRKMWEQLREMTARTDKQIGKLGNRFGEMVEHLIIPNLVEKFRALGYTFSRASLDSEFFNREGKALTEVDAWLENGEFAMAVEIKSHLREQDTDRHVKRMEILRGYLDERGDTRKLLGAVAGAVVSAPAREYAFERGFYLIEQSGDTVQIKTPGDFTPKVW
jgi:predicted AAA+ superfamily ATPase